MKIGMAINSASTPEIRSTRNHLATILLQAARLAEKTELWIEGREGKEWLEQLAKQVESKKVLDAF